MQNHTSTFLFTEHHYKQFQNTYSDGGCTLASVYIPK